MDLTFIMYLSNHPHLVVLVGFERIFTSVDEDIGSFELCVRIFTEAAFLPTHVDIDFSLDLITVSGTAGKLAISLNNFTVLIYFQLRCQ